MLPGWRRRRPHATAVGHASQMCSLGLKSFAEKSVVLHLSHLLPVVPHTDDVPNCVDVTTEPRQGFFSSSAAPSEATEERNTLRRQGSLTEGLGDGDVAVGVDSGTGVVSRFVVDVGVGVDGVESVAGGDD
jgi:hypothetical protein